MSNQHLAATLVIVALLLPLVFLQTATCQEYYQYSIQIGGDGSAYWTITQFSSANADVETWQGLQQKIFALIDDAQSLTHRNMDVDPNSVQINTTLSFESKTTEYSFIWQNFSAIEDNSVTFGDVFAVPDFFSQLFGDASLQVTYPADYTVQSVYPPPRQDSDHTLTWARTQDLASGEAKVVLTQSNDGADTSRRIGGLVAIVAVGIAVSLASYILYRRSKKARPTAPTQRETPAVIESEEDKIIGLLRAQGGVMRQSDITERTRFSKAKTSQLLSALEARGVLTRYKKGRDKIVTLKEGRKNKK
jgi:uncharacterized membrane protein